MTAFAGLRVIDLWPTRIGAQASQVFADFGADVIQVEPPGGAEIREHGAYPFWGRGKRSIVLDLHDATDRQTLVDLCRHADVLIETNPTGLLDDLGLGYADLAAVNPRLVYTSVTSFGRQGPHARTPVHEGLAMAKLGVFNAFKMMNTRDVPPYVNVPFASFAASQVAVHGILAALIERQRSGAGQWVETNLLQAFTALDNWAWYEYLIADRWPEAFVKTDTFDDRGRPASPLGLMVIVCLTKDGTWLQFASVAPHLFAATMNALGLAWMFDDPEWRGLPAFDGDVDKMTELWTRMLEAARSKTLDEWEAIFEADPNVFAEQFRNGPASLEHPQLLHDGMTIDVQDAEHGPVRQPAAIVKALGTPAELSRSAPRLDEHRSAIVELAGKAAQEPRRPSSPSPSSALPLDGVVILELATMFAGPHGTTMLTDLGARVIKVEPLGGDRIRMTLPFPESGGFKVMQGKESIAIDLSTPDGVALIQEVARTCDVVVQGYRAGAMGRLGLDYESIRALNPDIVYVNAPGYGVDGPYGAKPAYAPSIGAASGIPLGNIGSSVEVGPEMSIDELKDGVRRLFTAGMRANANADGVAALGVSTAILVGVAARSFGSGGQELLSSMLNTNTHLMSAQAVTYPGAPIEPAPDSTLSGTDALCRIYEASDGYVFVGVRTDSEWAAFVAGLGSRSDVADDPRFADSTGRRSNDGELTRLLADVMAQRTAVEWESIMLPLDVVCARVTTASIEQMLFDPAFGVASGYVANVTHPILDDHPRLAPFVRFSRSATQVLPGVLSGSDTDAILAELGKSADEIADLRARDIIA